MSSYAALVSLLHILGTLPDRGRQLIINNRPQLQSLCQKSIYLLDFLDNSSACKAALETKMREAAYKAEDLIESHIFRNLDSDSRSFRTSIKSSFRHVFLLSMVLILASNLFPVSLTNLQAIPVPIQIFMLRIATPILVAVLTCPTSAVFLRLCGLPAINLFQEHETQELRQVLCEFDTIVKEVIQIKEEEAHRDMDMSAYAALIPLRQILDSNLDSGSAHNRSQLESLHQKVIFLLDFLKNSSTYMTSHKSKLEDVEVKIRESVYRAKALIEFQIPAQFIMDSEKSSFWRRMKISLPATLPFVPAFTIVILVFTNFLQLIHASFQQVIPRWIRNQLATLIAVALSFGAYVLCTSGFVLAFRVLEASKNHGEHENEDLHQVIDDFSVIVRKVIWIKDARGNSNNLPATAAAASHRWGLGGSGMKFVVGRDIDLEQIKDRLTRDSPKLEVVSIVGMAGIGKTTLANQVYEDPYIIEKFDVRAWITVSQHSFRDVLRGPLDSVKKLTKEMQDENDDGQLALHLYQYLMGRTYLIVMDDVWDIEIWDNVKNYFPENNNGSRVLLTSQLSQVACHLNSSTLHQMQFLDAKESWDLLREKVFGAEACPLELESIGKEIAQKCSGLPLAIIVVGGLLCKDKRSEIWRDITRDINSKLGQSKERYLEILGLSYNHLPQHLRPCFLYMGTFLGDGDIPVSRLIGLWAAEGFLKPSSSKTLEDVVEDSLKDLIDRNLIMVCKRSCNGKIRTCCMHGLLRDVSQLKARKEGFLHVVQWSGNVRRDETLRRLTIRSDARLVDSSPRHNHFLTRCYYVRSFLCTSMLFSHHHVAYLRYVRVLDVLVVHFSKFPDQIMGLLLLRYLAFHCDGLLPTSMSKLKNLETIVYHHSSSRNYPLFHRVIWNMPSLRHFYAKPSCYLSTPLGFILPWKSSALENLQTLVGIRNFRWSKGIIERTPNLKKLGVSYDVLSSVDWAAYQLDTLVHLTQLESLKISIEYNDEVSTITRDTPKLAFPQELRKLSLSGSGIPWASIGGLPNLEALKLKRETCSGELWKTAEGEFPELVFLLLEEMSLRSWETGAGHFPHLRRVVIRSCGMLEEIPEAIGDITTLETIELVDCHRLAVESAIKIQEDQESMGNEGLKVCFAGV